MSRDAEKLLNKVGGKRTVSTRHIVYHVKAVGNPAREERFTIPQGTKENPRQLTSVRSRLRQLGYKV